MLDHFYFSIFVLLSSSLLLYSQNFGRCILRFSSSVLCRTKEQESRTHGGYEHLVKELLNRVIWRLQVQSWLQVKITRITYYSLTLVLGHGNWIKTIYHCGLKKGFGSKFLVGFLVRQGTPKEGRTTHQPKRCECNDKDEDNSLNTLNDIKSNKE